MKYEFFDRLCKAHHVTPYKVSKATGISTGTLSHWKKGLYSPKAEKIQRIADYFDVPLEYFTTGMFNPSSASPLFSCIPTVFKASRGFRVVCFSLLKTVFLLFFANFC